MPGINGHCNDSLHLQGWFFLYRRIRLRFGDFSVWLLRGLFRSHAFKLKAAIGFRFCQAQGTGNFILPHHRIPGLVQQSQQWINRLLGIEINHKTVFVLRNGIDGKNFRLHFGFQVKDKAHRVGIVLRHTNLLHIGVISLKAACEVF